MALQPRLLLATSSDDRFPPEAMFDGNEKTSFLTTGMYPQEILISFGEDAPKVNITKVSLTGHGIKKLRVERCVEEYATTFEPMVDCEVNASEPNVLQREVYQVNKSTVGANVRYVKVVIAAGHEAFSAITTLAFEGSKASA